MSLPEDLKSTSKANAYEKYVMQTKLVEDRDWICCANCFSVDGFSCKKYKQQIPPKVAVLGCDQWDGLPF